MKSLLPQPHRHAFEPPMHYLVSAPKGHLTRLQYYLIRRPWQEARPGAQVKRQYEVSCSAKVFFRLGPRWA